jgi:protein tyrosine/serine phosphatase
MLAFADPAVLYLIKKEFVNRNLSWNDCLNVRDLGGLRTASGASTKFNVFVRADALDRLSAQGLDSLKAYGIKTIIDLRDQRETKNARPGTDELIRMHLPLEDQSDQAFWDKWGNGYNCTPLYYKAFLEQSPERVVGVFCAIADSHPGGLVFHCGVGRDRTGLIAILLLALVSVELDEIAADYELSADNLKPLTEIAEAQKVKEIFEKHETTSRTTLHELLRDFDVEDYLLQHGVSADQIKRIRTRLLG